MNTTDSGNRDPSLIDPREEALFDAALELPAAERAAFLRAECGDDAALYSSVAGLLSIHDSEFGVLDRAPLGLATAEAAFASGDTIGPYTLVEEIGSGGMGVVFRAEQAEPVRREVALKLIKPGMDTRSVIARFEGERQALALLDHPAITKVFDAGATSTGRPYFVMELCRGVSITEFCRQRKLSLDDRLRLLARVSDAIEHAHQKGILHRDLKPSNVLVTDDAGTPTPKVIDFGVAKALTLPLAGETLVTHAGQVIGTPEYTSPEQSENGLDVDTRSDVYSLGVLLYELLTDVTPVAALGVTGSGVLDAVRTQDPPPPSQRLRREERLAESRQCRGEIDWIVARALEKDRADRYQSAAELARDLRGHLAGDAVIAAAPTIGYRTRKIFNRHRAAVLTGGTIALILLAATIVSTTLAIRLDDSLEEARIERDRAIEAEGKLAAMERDQRNQAAIYRALARYAEETFFGGAFPPPAWSGVPSIDETAAAILEDLGGADQLALTSEGDETPITIETVVNLIREAHGMAANDLDSLGSDPAIFEIDRHTRGTGFGPVRVETASVRLFFDGIDLSGDFDLDLAPRESPEARGDSHPRRAEARVRRRRSDHRSDPRRDRAPEGGNSAPARCLDRSARRGVDRALPSPRRAEPSLKSSEEIVTLLSRRAGRSAPRAVERALPSAIVEKGEASWRPLCNRVERVSSSRSSERASAWCSRPPPRPVFGGPTPSSKVGKEQLLAVSNAKGEPGFVPLEEVEVISIDGVAPKDLLATERA